MPKAASVRVTGELLKALDDVKKAMRALPAGEARRTGLAGQRVLEKALRAKAKPLPTVTSCPRDLPNI
ncbi:MAG: hypothetical protein PHI34_02485 [Acidobacteriota bacterium]|nr:hypothetical protein [Acidobacteriota bacterium]